MPQIPIQVTFHGLRHSDALESQIRERVNWLEQFYPGIVRCRVLVELPHRHRQVGRDIHVRIELTVPGGAPIVVSREPSLHRDLKDNGGSAHRKDTEVEGVRDAGVAIRRAFGAARRRLADFAREQRGDVKWHEAPARGQGSRAEG